MNRTVAYCVFLSAVFFCGPLATHAGEGPYQATGIRIGEVGPSSAITEGESWLFAVAIGQA